MSKKKEDIFIKDIVVPEIVQKKADIAFSKIQTEGKNRKKVKIFRYQAAAIICICFLGIGTVSLAAAAFHFWSRGMQGNLQATDIQQEELSEKGFSTILEEKPNDDTIAVTDNGITVKPIETIVDGHFANLSFSVEGYNLDPKKEPCFEFVEVYVGDNKEEESAFLNMGGSFYNGIVAGVDGKPVYDSGEELELDKEGNLISHYLTEEGTLEYVMTVYSPNIGESLIGKTIHIEFKNIGTADKAQFENVVEGKWNFEITLSGQDAATQYILNEELGESGAVVSSVQLSPISIKVNYIYTGDTFQENGVDENGDLVVAEMFTEPPQFCGIKLKDGTLIQYLTNGGMSGYTDESANEYYSLFMFDRVIDIDQVQSLLFRDWPNGNSESTQDELYILPINK